MQIRNTWLAAVAAAAFTLTASAAFAQTGGAAKTGGQPGKGGAQGGPKGGQKGGPRGGARMMMGNPEQLAKDLNLTKDQQTKLKALSEKMQKQGETIRADKSLSEDQRRQKMMGVFQGYSQQMQAILTSEQKQKLQKMMEERMKQMRERRQQGGGPGGAAKGGGAPKKG